jgi:hypothetical protein
MAVDKEACAYAHTVGRFLTEWFFIYRPIGSPELLEVLRGDEAKSVIDTAHRSEITVDGAQSRVSVLSREPGAENPLARFGERDVETELSCVINQSLSEA